MSEEQILENEEIEVSQVEEVVEQPEVEEQPEVQEDKVPLATLLEEKKRRKDLEKRLRQLEEKELDNEILQTKNNIKQKYLEKGYEEDLADLLSTDIAEIKKEVKKTKLKDTEDLILDEDIKDVARDPFYSDAESYSKEIKSKLKEFKSKGVELSVEDAYHLVRGKSRLKEVKEDVEQKALLKRREESTPSKVPNASSSAPTNPYKLDDTDKKALKNLQKMMPEAGWTEKKYFELMKK